MLRRSLVALAMGTPALSGCCDHDYTPVERDDWPVSTPEAEGLDPDAVDDLYCNARWRDTLYGLLVIKNGQLVAEKYFNGTGSIDEVGNRQSVTKSYTSALVGLAIQEGCLTGVDETMIDHFPELIDDIEDERKLEITIEQMLQMRAGYPWEESEEGYYDELFTGDWLDDIVAFPLVAEPGSTMIYSNLTTHWLGIIVARACGTDLASFAREHLFEPMDASFGDWTQDVDGNYLGFAELSVSARDMAKLGQLYLDEGRWDGEVLLDEDYVRASLTSYGSPGPIELPTRHMDRYGYGYQWWSGEAGGHHVDFAYGHGGQYIFVVDALDLVVVVTADPFHHERSSSRSWRREKRLLNMVAKFIGKL